MSCAEKQPFLSIVLPTYNVGKYIDRCLKSCVNQTYKSIEVIVVDDCGQDDSIAKAEKWTLEDDRIRIVRNPRNLGTYHARRAGTEAANGIYVLFLDPDDELASNAAEVICKEVANNKVDVIFFAAQQIPKAGSLLRKPKLPIQASSGRRAAEAILKTRSLNYGTAGKAYLAATLRQAFKFLDIGPGVRLVYAEDALIFYAALSYTRKFISIPQPLYRYYRNDDSITKSASEESRLLKSEQIELVVDIISQTLRTSALNAENKKAQVALKKIPAKLMSDKHLLSRYSTDPSTGKSRYLTSVFNSMLARRSLADAVRILIFLFSAGKKKL